MTITDPLELQGCQVTNIVLKLKAGIFTAIELDARAMITEKLAKQLGIDHMLYQNGVTRDCFSLVELDLYMPMFHAVFQADLLRQSLTIDGSSINHFTVERASSGGLTLRLRMTYTGEPYDAINYVKAVGSAHAVVTIAPVQSLLPLNNIPEVGSMQMQKALFRARAKGTQTPS